MKTIIQKQHNGGHSVMTKKRFKQISANLEDMLQNKLDKTEIESLIEMVCDVMKFDPLAKDYNTERIQRLMRETGKSSYELYEKKHYESNKTQLNQKRVQKRREQRALEQLNTGLDKVFI